MVLLDTLANLGLNDETIVVRTADHGEMAMAHGGQRQKMFNMYQESVIVPLVYSNPILWPEPMNSSALVSHVDFVPTMASLLGLGREFSRAAGWDGVDYSSIITGGRTSVQDYVVFTYDDFQW